MLSAQSAPHFPQGAVMCTRGAQAALVPGRMVLLADPATGLPQLATLLSSPTAVPARCYRTLSSFSPHLFDPCAFARCQAVYLAAVKVPELRGARRWCCPVLSCSQAASMHKKRLHDLHQPDGNDLHS